MSVNVVRIPLSARPQRLQVLLAGVIYGIRLYWLVPANCWAIDLSDHNGNPLISGIALVTGGDLFAQFGYINLGGQLLVMSDNQPLASADPPGWRDLDVTGHVFFIPDQQGF